MVSIKKILIATGGTGGHIFPAYSLAKNFLDQDKDVIVTSDARGIKYLKDFPQLKVININSSIIDNKNFFRLIRSIFLIFFSFCKSLFLLLKRKPNLIFGMGGYSSFPVCLASKFIGIPFVIYENNLHIGKANKFLLPFAKKIIVSYAELDGIPFKYRNKVCEVGNIIREEIIKFPIQSKDKTIKGKLAILVIGGSQAAQIFAEKLPDIFEKCLSSNIKLKIFQQCLPAQNNDLENLYKNLNIDYEIFNYSKSIIKYFSMTDLAITRSGSSMLAELLNARIPFISVPLPSSADNHQLKNAIYYEKKGYSYLIEEKHLTTRLFDLIKKINDEKLLDQIIKTQAQYSDKSVYKNVNNIINEIINEKY
tara:strand:+ start:1785 stop:2879 length:1095 start_codon:yes stop_codon:yes gene_type:complete